MNYMKAVNMLKEHGFRVVNTGTDGVAMNNGYVGIAVYENSSGVVGKMLCYVSEGSGFVRYIAEYNPCAMWKMKCYHGNIEEMMEILCGSPNNIVVRIKQLALSSMKSIRYYLQRRSVNHLIK